MLIEKFIRLSYVIFTNKVNNKININERKNVNKIKYEWIF